jgi:hypothetical protein
MYSIAGPYYIIVFTVLLIIGVFYPIIVFANNSVLINNHVSGCVTVKDNEIINMENITLLKVDMKLLKSAGMCGCKSAALSYSSSIKNRHSVIIIQGIISSLKGGKKILVINTDNAIAFQGDYIIDLTCSNPP